MQLLDFADEILLEIIVNLSVESIFSIREVLILDPLISIDLNSHLLLVALRSLAYDFMTLPGFVLCGYEYATTGC